MPKDKTRSKPSGLPIIHPYAAGIDIGSRFHVVAVSPRSVRRACSNISGIYQRPAANGHRYQNRGDGIDRGLLGRSLRSAGVARS